MKKPSSGAVLGSKPFKWKPPALAPPRPVYFAGNAAPTARHVPLPALPDACRGPTVAECRVAYGDAMASRAHDGHGPSRLQHQVATSRALLRAPRNISGRLFYKRRPKMASWPSPFMAIEALRSRGRPSTRGPSGWRAPAIARASAPRLGTEHRSKEANAGLDHVPAEAQLGPKKGGGKEISQENMDTSSRLPTCASPMDAW